jgi:hypothetical protein
MVDSGKENLLFTRRRELSAARVKEWLRFSYNKLRASCQVRADSRSQQILGGLSLIALAGTLVGCAGTGTAHKTPTPSQDYALYRQLLVSGIGQVDSTLRALDDLSARANRDPRPAYEAFARTVERLEVDSVRVREHTQAMRSRGDAYFEHWEEWMAGGDNESVRQRAAEHREELRRSFEAVRASSEQVRKDFRLLLTDLQKLCAVLEQEPTLAHIDAQKELILAADEKGETVEHGLERILSEMNTITVLLRGPKETARH